MPVGFCNEACADRSRQDCVPEGINLITTELWCAAALVRYMHAAWPSAVQCRRPGELVVTIKIFWTVNKIVLSWTEGAHKPYSEH